MVVQTASHASSLVTLGSDVSGCTSQLSEVKRVVDDHGGIVKLLVDRVAALEASLGHGSSVSRDDVATMIQQHIVDSKRAGEWIVTYGWKAPLCATLCGTRS